MAVLKVQRLGGAVILMKNVEYLVGSPNITNAPLKPYSDEVIEFASQLSKCLMKSPALRVYPDISALAFWYRKANLIKMKENCIDADKRLGRGLCFHLAPGNIPINFAFSYMFGLLSGCSNIVRLSSKPYPQIKPVCDAVIETLKEFPEIEKRTAFIRYQADDETTMEFCKNSDARIIWGGDSTIAKVKAMPTKPRCVDICFADRYSISIIDGKTVMDADENTVIRLAEYFYNDTYLMDQNACSSEQLIFWVNDSGDARKKFWDAIYSYAVEKYNLQAAVSVDKYTHMYEDILDGNPIAKIERKSNLLYRVELSKLEGDITSLRGKGGYFYEYKLCDLDEIVPFITDKFQTVTYFGVDAEEIRKFVINNNLRGIDRIVPIGKAMDIDIMWDGFDVVRMLSRYVDKE